MFYYCYSIVILMHQDHHQILYEAVRRLIPPPNPIIDRNVIESEPVQQFSKFSNSPQPEDLNSDEDQDFDEGEHTLLNAYSKMIMIFDKWPNRSNSRNGIKYYASNFIERKSKGNSQYSGQITENSLEFNSNFECGNLLAVYKTGADSYDLILQNDINSGGYTQWFNFTVSNFKQRGTIRFNIVNFYKKDSLFKQGMKPLSKSHIFDKNWKRSCHNVTYFISDILMQGRKSKYYKVLSFKYDFIFENDTVQFCSCLPYSNQNLNQFVKNLNSSKLRVKYLGATPLKKILTILQISTQSEEKSKKAIIFMARQHAGETPSSHIIQYLIEQLLSSTQQNEFLLSKYNFYFFPMINVDGVSLGNYRCNFYGFDLNRCWNLQESKKLPQISMIKNQIRRIMKRQPVELIVDLHGHSSKMNSFFYGNTFGKYNFLFPYVASKIEEFIDFNECSFTQEEYEKSNTARAILGNMIRETGSAYTYEVSLFGGIRNGKKIAFTLENYQNMAKSLVLALYKCDVELYKEEKLLKESLYLKEVRKELKRYEVRFKNKNDPGSDDEAKKTSLIEEKAKIEPQRLTALQKQASQKEKHPRWELKTSQQESQVVFEFSLDQYKLYSSYITELNQKKFSQPQSRRKKLSFAIRKVVGAEQTSRKHELMSKLRIFGETLAQDSSVLEFSNKVLQTVTKQTQTILTVKWNQQQEYKVNEFNRQANQSTFLTGSFMGRRLGEPRTRRKQRFYKSNSTRVTQAEVSFGDLIKHNKLSFY